MNKMAGSLTVSQFGSMFTPRFADHSWITDTKTFFPDAKLMWQNAALSLELCGLHNMYFTSSPYANMDFGTSLANIWNQAYQSANASMASSLGSFAAMQNFFPTFQPVGQTPSQAASDPAPKSTLTEEEKTEFEAKQAKFNELMEKYSDKKIDKAVAEKLGLDSAIKWAKEAFKKADTPEKVEKCIEDFEIKLAEIAEEKDAEELLELLPMKNESEEFWEELEIKVEDLYDESSDFESKIYNLICGECRSFTSTAQSLSRSFTSSQSLPTKPTRHLKSSALTFRATSRWLAATPLRPATIAI